MRRHVLRSVSLTALLILGSGIASGQEQLTMPFACSVKGTKVVLTPSAEQTYPVAGQRQQQLFTACHPQNQAVCRTFPVHSFTIACGRNHVKWIEIAAAASDPQAGRVFVDGGQLHMAVGRARLGPGRLCDDGASHPSRWRPGYRSRQDGDCDEGGQRGRDDLVVLPAGFAPLGLAEAYLMPAPKETYIVPAPVVPAPKMVSRDDGAARSQDQPSVVAQAQRGDPAAQGPSRAATRPSASAPAITASGSPSTSHPDRTGEDRTKVDSYVRREPEVRPAPAPAQLPATAPESPPAEVEPIVTVSSGKAGADLQETTSATAESIHDDSVGNGGADRSVARVAAIGLVAGLGVVSLFAWLGMRRRRPATPVSLGRLQRVEPGRALVDVTQWKRMCETLYHTAAAHLEHIEAHVEALESAPPLRRVLRREAQISMERVKAAVAKEPANGEEWRRLKLRLERIVHDLAKLKEIAEGALASLAGRNQSRELPRDKGEAYAALGVNPDVSEGILKKLVGALRASWHPDQARDDEDRRQREQRIKEINIAWDLITGKRQEA